MDARYISSNRPFSLTSRGQKYKHTFSLPARGQKYKRQMIFLHAAHYNLSVSVPLIQQKSDKIYAI